MAPTCLPLLLFCRSLLDSRLPYRSTPVVSLSWAMPRSRANLSAPQLVTQDDLRSQTVNAIQTACCTAFALASTVLLEPPYQFLSTIQAASCSAYQLQAAATPYQYLQLRPFWESGSRARVRSPRDGGRRVQLAAHPRSTDKVFAGRSV